MLTRSSAIIEEQCDALLAEISSTAASAEMSTVSENCCLLVRPITIIKFGRVLKIEYIFILQLVTVSLPSAFWHGLQLNLLGPSKFQRVSRLAFATATTSLNGGQPNFARCLADSWAGTLHIHVRGSYPWRNFARCKIHFASKSCVLLYCQRYCAALQQRASAKLCGVIQRMELRKFCRGRRLYSAGRASCWTSAHNLVPY